MVLVLPRAAKVTYADYRIDIVPRVEVTLRQLVRIVSFSDMSKIIDFSMIGGFITFNVILLLKKRKLLT